MQTLINQHLHTAPRTRLNPLLSHSVVTRLNEHLQDRCLLEGGVLLNDRYLLGEPLEVAAGEAELYFCTDTVSPSETRYVAKLYRRTGRTQRPVMEVIAALDSPHIGKLCACGVWNGRPYEILPYYERGSLQGQRCSYEELRTGILPALNEALKTLHDAGILHKDLKPANIMRKTDGGIAVIDFGVSAKIESGTTMLVDQAGMTLAYSAPETFRDIFLRESDYYALGITVFELFTGRLPYSGLTGSDLERMVAVQKIPLPADMPVALQELITGLTYGDISNRRDKTNPNRRWTYEEVSRWLAGEKQPVPGRGSGLLESRPYEFLGKPYKDLAQLAEALAVNWNSGKHELFKGNLTAYFRRTNDILAELCSHAEERAAAVSGQDDLIFWETIYQLLPETKRLYWGGAYWENLPALGRDILEDARVGNRRVKALAGEMLEHGVLNRYIRLFDPEAFSKQLKLLRELTGLYLREYEDAAARERYILELGYLLSGQIVLNLDGQSFYSLRDLKEYMLLHYNESYEALRKLCAKLLDRKQNLTPQFEVWLLAMGKGREVRAWKEELGFIGEDIP